MHSDICVLDISHWRLSYYSSHDGPVIVHGNNNDNSVRMRQAFAWQEPGSHFKLGQMPLPRMLLEEGHNCPLSYLTPAVSLSAHL